MEINPAMDDEEELLRGPAALMEASNRSLRSANRKRNFSLALLIFTALCAPAILATLGWAITFISNMREDASRRDKEQAVFMSEIQHAFVAVNAKVDDLKTEMREAFADVRKRQDASDLKAESNVRAFDIRINTLEGKVNEMNTILRVRGFYSDGPPQRK